MFQLLLLSAVVAQTTCRNVEYFIQAEEIDWNYAPSGQDIINEDQTNARLYLERKTYRKVVYREYTNSLFEDKAPRNEHLGILGPTLQANVGDVLIVHFRNLGSNLHSIHPTRLSYTKDNEGSMYFQLSGLPTPPDDAVIPGQTFTYQWNVSALGLPPPDVTCVSGLYYSDTNRDRDVNSGLVGFLIVCTQDYVAEPEDRNINMLFQSFDENLSWYSDSRNAPQEQHIMHSVNGFVFGNAPSLQICIGDDVTMHFGSVGDASEPHTARIHGHNFVYMGKRQPSVPIMAGLTVDAKFQAMESGNWLMTSQNPKLMKAGMQTMVTIADCGNPPIDIPVNRLLRRYYIAIDNVMIPGRSEAAVGFVPYVDSRFTMRMMRTRDHDYLGVLGPLIHAEIGDTIKIVVKNNDTHSHSLQPHGGVRVHKYNEGAFYNDTIDTAPIHPGHLKTYYWTVSDLSGPTAYNSPCMPSFYTSGVDVISEVHTGLIGPMLICQRGLVENMIPSMRDVFLFYIRSNNEESNEIHGLNGFPPNAFPRIEISQGETATLHAMNIGTDDKASSLFADGIPFSLGGSSIFSVGLHHGLIKSTKLVGSLEGQWKIENTAGTELSFDFRVGSGLEARDPLMATVNKTFYIAIVNEYYDYSDRMYNERDFRSQQHGIYRTGPEFRKAMFKCYKWSDFFWSCTKKAKGQRPALRVVVGTDIKIVFRNDGDRDYSMYSPGVIIRRRDGGTRLVVPPGEEVEFIWTIPERIGPGSGDQDCVMRRYYSNVNPERDVASGLIGPLIVCRDHAAVTNDETVNMPWLVGVVDEGRSWYIDENIPDEYASINRSDPSFIRNNRITVVDYRAATPQQIREGYINEDIGYYLHNVGDTFHSIHFHGCIVSAGSDSDLIGQNVVPLFPAETKHVIFTCRQIGRWKMEGMRYQHKIANRELFGIVSIYPEPTGGIS